MTRLQQQRRHLKHEEQSAKEAREFAFIVNEYENLSTYYVRLLEEGHKVIEYYFKTVTIPSAAIAASSFLAASQDFIPNPSLTIGAALGVLFLVGVCCFIYYTLETSHSKRFLQSIRDIRGILAEDYPKLARALTIDRLEIDAKFLWLSLAFYRAGPMIAINSAVGSFSFMLVCDKPNSAGILVFLVIFISHIVFWNSRPMKPELREPESRTAQ